MHWGPYSNPKWFVLKHSLPRLGLSTHVQGAQEANAGGFAGFPWFVSLRLKLTGMGRMLFPWQPPLLADSGEASFQLNLPGSLHAPEGCLAGNGGRFGGAACPGLPTAARAPGFQKVIIGAVALLISRVSSYPLG